MLIDELFTYSLSDELFTYLLIDKLLIYSLTNELIIKVLLLINYFIIVSLFNVRLINNY